jgi:hypothetical protein
VFFIRRRGLAAVDWFAVVVVVVVGRRKYHFGIRHVCFSLLVPLRGCEVTYCPVSMVRRHATAFAGGSFNPHTNDQRVLWELFEEALLRGSVDVEVQGLRLAGQKCQTG